MGNYNRGRKYEYEVKKQFEKAGWRVFRCAGSKPIDLIAFYPNGSLGNKVLWIECRLKRRPSQAEQEFWKEEAQRYGAEYRVFVKNKQED